MKELTDEQLNIAICEWRGWKISENGRYAIDPLGNCRTAGLPSHITGIEALGNMHEAEKGLTEEQLRFYDRQLVRVQAQEDKDENWSPERLACTYIWHTSARQRAIALLRVVKPEMFHNE